MISIVSYLIPERGTVMKNSYLICFELFNPNAKVQHAGNKNQNQTPHLFFNHGQNFYCFSKKFLNSIILMLWYSLQNVGKETKLLIMVQGHPWSSIQNLQINLKNCIHMTKYKNDNSNKFQKVCRNFKMMTKFPKNYKVLNC